LAPKDRPTKEAPKGEFLHYERFKERLLELLESLVEVRVDDNIRNVRVLLLVLILLVLLGLSGGLSSGGLSVTH
jgi:hypothetical protein